MRGWARAVWFAAMGGLGRGCPTDVPREAVDAPGCTDDLHTILPWADGRFRAVRVRSLPAGCDLGDESVWIRSQVDVVAGADGTVRWRDDGASGARLRSMSYCGLYPRSAGVGAELPRPGVDGLECPYDPNPPHDPTRSVATAPGCTASVVGLGEAMVGDVPVVFWWVETSRDAQGAVDGFEWLAWCAIDGLPVDPERLPVPRPALRVSYARDEEA